ncbi:MAG: hypothetical protein ACYC6X_00080 [Minisyncoccota bacterium]
MRKPGHVFLDKVLDAFVIEKGRAPVAQTFTPKKESFAIGQTFRVGGTDKEKLISQVKAVGILHAQAENLIRRSTFAIQADPEDIDTIALTPIDLMLLGEERVPIMTTELFNPERLEQWSKENAVRLPYGHVIDLLPVETSLHVRIEYRDQPSGETLVIATARIVDSDPTEGITPFLLCVKRWRNGRKQSLDACRALPDTQWWPPLVQPHTPPPQILFRLRRVA